MSQTPTVKMQTKVNGRGWPGLSCQEMVADEVAPVSRSAQNVTCNVECNNLNCRYIDCGRVSRSYGCYMLVLQIASVAIDLNIVTSDFIGNTWSKSTTPLNSLISMGQARAPSLILLLALSIETRKTTEEVSDILSVQIAG